MLLNLQELVLKHGMNIRGVVQVGCHFSEEHEEYVKAGAKNFFYIEPTPSSMNVLIDKHMKADNVELRMCACGSSYKIASMYTETKNHGQSNSLLKPKNHLNQYSDILFEDIEKVEVFTLDYLVSVLEYKYNFLSLDVQCYELEVLKGATCILKNMDYVMTEVNNVGAELYEGCTDIDELDEFLEKYNFKRVEEPKWVGGTWSDTLYISNRLLN